MKAVAVSKFRADVEARYRSSIARFDLEFSDLPIGVRRTAANGLCGTKATHLV
jgi:hypothetical protein